MPICRSLHPCSMGYISRRNSRHILRRSWNMHHPLLERMRYIALSVYPGALAPESLVRLMNDPSARVRLNAVIEAGKRRDPSLLPDIETRLKDPQMNVRTKACQALGRLGSDQAISLLDKTVRIDPSWYVRDYAYAAMGRIRPEARVVRISGVK